MAEKWKWKPGKNCCGCETGCSCCKPLPSAWSIAFTSNWGSGLAPACTSSGSAAMCQEIGNAHFPSPAIVTQPPFPTTVWPDALIFGSGDSYVNVNNRSCLYNGVRMLYNLTGCWIDVLAALYKASGDTACRLVVGFAFGTGGVSIVLYRSPLITNCCSMQTLSYYRSGISGGCGLKPATITATPVC